MSTEKLNDIFEKHKDVIDEISDTLNIDNNEIKNKLIALSNINAIELKDVCVVYNKNQFILKNVNFTIQKGTFNAFIGQNGAGKSTTIKAIIGTLEHKSGKILINGIEQSSNSTEISNLSFCPEETVFPNNLTVFNFLYLTIGLIRGYNRRLKEEITEWLMKFDLLKYKNKKPRRLSTGQKKSIMLISTILRKPKIIILDEPMVNLDVRTKNKFFQELKELQKQGSTILFSTHQIDEIKKYADNIVLIEKGEILYSGIFDNKYLEYYSK